MKLTDLQSLTFDLVHINQQTNTTLVRTKTQRALSDLKHAKTLIAKAEQTLAWAQGYNHHNVKL